ncbi:MAG: nucleotidyltransferase family protein [Acholeplasmataceae bacterium]
MKNKELLIILFKLIEKSFKEEKYLFKSTNENELFRLIYENGLTGLVFNYIDENSFANKKIYNKLKNINYNFIMTDIRQENNINIINESFNQNKIKHIFLKGSHLKKLYPKPHMRGMGDIDVLVSKNDFNKSIDILKGLGYKLTSATSHHHVFESIDKETIELHQNITSIVEYDNKDFLKNAWDYANLDNDCLYKFELEFEYIYLLTHLVRHLRTSGIGLRSILDIYVFLNKYEKNLNKELLNQMLVETNLLTFSEKLKKINNIILGNELSTEEDMLGINYIISSGIHGKGLDHDYYIVKKTFETKRNKKGKFRFYLGEIFPSKLRIEESYPYLKKYPFLLPWAWFVRILKQIFKKPKDTKERIRSIKTSDKEEDLKKVFEYFNI